MANVPNPAIEKPWAVYETINRTQVGCVAGEYPSRVNPHSVDLMQAERGNPITRLTCDLFGRFATPLEAIERATCDHDGGQRGIIKGSRREDLVGYFEESFKSVKLE